MIPEPLLDLLALTLVNSAMEKSASRKHAAHRGKTRKYRGWTDPVTGPEGELHADPYQQGALFLMNHAQGVHSGTDKLDAGGGRWLVPAQEKTAAASAIPEILTGIAATAGGVKYLHDHASDGTQPFPADLEPKPEHRYTAMGGPVNKAALAGAVGLPIATGLGAYMLSGSGGASAAEKQKRQGLASRSVT